MKSVKLGTIMAEIVLDVGGSEVVAEISKASAKRLKLKKGEARYRSAEPDSTAVTVWLVTEARLTGSPNHWFRPGASPKPAT